MVMEAAIECNNIGVALLKARRMDEALETFKRAARMMYPVSRFFQTTSSQMVMMNGDTISSSPTTSASLSSFQQSSTPAAHNNSMDVDIDIVEKTMNLQRVKAELPVVKEQEEYASMLRPIVCENSFILSEPIAIDHIQHTFHPPISCTRESAAIIYNMGLVYRLSGSSFCLLQKSWSLFDMAFSVAFSVSNDVRARQIAMACLNNAGEIQHALGNYQLSRAYLDTLYTLILSLPPAADEGTLKERHQLLLNVMLLQEPKIAGAA